MNNKSLFNGIAIVIDDEIGKKDANINNLIQQIEKRKMPYVPYKSLPEEDLLIHLEGISFLLFDWKLISDDLRSNGVRISDSTYVDANIKFLKKLEKKIFVPVFIFTNEDENEIVRILRENNLYHHDKPNYIFVKKKDELKGRTKLFKEIEEWARKVPSIYVLKEWEIQYRSAKNNLFHDFYNLNPLWPMILWAAFEDDNVNMSCELGEVITRNIHTRMEPFTFDDGILKRRGRSPDYSHSPLKKRAS
ncbi:MAG: hypothetical protein AB1638_12745 [Nitrospirota bacterium]